MHVVLFVACKVKKDCMILKNALITLHFLYIELKAFCQYTSHLLTSEIFCDLKLK